MNFRKLFLVVGIVAVASITLAQGFGRGMRTGPMAANPGILLTRDDVKADLKDANIPITDEQIAKLAEIRDGVQAQIQQVFQDSAGDMAAARKAMEPIIKKSTEQIIKILTPEQQKRIKEIGIQVGGNAVLTTDTDLQSELALTADQKARIKDLSDKQQAANQALFEKARSGDIDRSQMPDIMKKNGEILNNEIAKILTEDQKTKLKALAGKPFKASDDSGN